MKAEWTGRNGRIVRPAIEHPARAEGGGVRVLVEVQGEPVVDAAVAGVVLDGPRVEAARVGADRIPEVVGAVGGHGLAMGEYVNKCRFQSNRNQRYIRLHLSLSAFRLGLSRDDILAHG